jgi:hypothetical protein
MATVKAIIKPNKLNKEGKAPIVIRVTHNGSNTTYSIQRVVEPKYWNPASARSKVRANCPGAAKLNIKINKVVGELQAIIDDKDNNNYTAKSIVKEYLNKDKADSPTQVYALIREFIDKNPDNISHITLKTYNKVNNCINAYDPHCDIKDIDLEWIKKYEKHLTKKGKAVTTSDSTMRLGLTFYGPYTNETAAVDMIFFEEGDSIKLIFDADTLYGDFNYVSESFYALIFNLEGFDCAIIPKSSVESFGEELIMAGLGN